VYGCDSRVYGITRYRARHRKLWSSIGPTNRPSSESLRPLVKALQHLATNGAQRARCFLSSERNHRFQACAELYGAPAKSSFDPADLSYSSHFAQAFESIDWSFTVSTVGRSFAGKHSGSWFRRDVHISQNYEQMQPVRFHAHLFKRTTCSKKRLSFSSSFAKARTPLRHPAADCTNLPSEKHHVACRWQHALIFRLLKIHCPRLAFRLGFLAGPPPWDCAFLVQIMTETAQWCHLA